MADHPAPFVGHAPDDPYISDRINATNRQRLTWALSIFAVVHIAHIAIFWPYTPHASANADLWRNGVITVHAALAAFIAVILPVNLLLDKRKRIPGTVLGAIPELATLVYLFGGATLAIVDQRVTSSINALLSAALGVGLVIMLRPLVALINYILVLTYFVIGVAWTQADANLLLSIRVNAITATGIGCALAIIQWRNQIVSLRQQRQIDEQKRELEAKNQELTLLATRDPLTGLLNRAQFTLEANREVAKLHKKGCTACLLMIDVDHFKQINDTFGHPAGDSILVLVAGIITRMLRSTDLVARMGGEEFTVLLPVAALAEGMRVAEKLRLAIAQYPFSIGEQSVQVTASFGVADCPIGSIDALNRSYLAADLALYQAKNDGRNCVRSGELAHQPR